MSELVLITGGCGFVGSHLVDAYLERGYAVRVLDNLDPVVHGTGENPPPYFNRRAEFIPGDVRDAETLARCLDGVSIVSHHAAAVSVVQSMSSPSKFVETNILGTSRLLELLADRDQYPVRKLIIPSSMSIYGEGRYRQGGTDVYPALRSQAQLDRQSWEIEWDGRPCDHAPTAETKPLQPTSIYAMTKRDQEEMSLSMGRTFGIPTIALRYFNIYGPRQSLSNPYTGVAAIFSGRLYNGNPPIVFEDGGQLRDFVNIKDVVDANLLATESERGIGQAFNIGSGIPISILEISNILIRKFGYAGAAEVTHTARPGDIRHCYADIGKAVELLEYNPTAVFDESIEELISWVSEQQAAADSFVSAYQDMGIPLARTET